MKKKQLTRNNVGYFALTIMLLGSIPLHSQSAIFVSNQDSEFSRIRNYTTTVDITFSYMLDTLSFNYVDRSTMTTRSIRIPSTFYIFDFIVYHDSVFFCGSDSGPMYGYFDIRDAFFNNGYIKCYYPTVPTPFFNKIDVTTISSGKTHMLMTGWNYLYGKKNNHFSNDSVNYFNKDSIISQYGVLLEAWESSSITNDIRYSIDSNCNFYYDDVAFTDNYAVVTARKSNNPTTHDFFYYKSPVPPTTSFLESWTSPAPSLSNTPIMMTLPMPSIGEILVRKIQKDTFATACNNGFTDDVTISIYPSPTQQSIIRFKIPGINVLDDFVYSTFQRTFYMMTTLPHYVFCYTQFPFSTSYQLMETNFGHRRLSLDITDNGHRVILSGLEGISSSVAPKHFWLFDENNINSCFPKTGISNVNQNNSDNSVFYQQYIDKNNIRSKSFSTKPTIYNLEIECQ